MTTADVQAKIRSLAIRLDSAESPEEKQFLQETIAELSASSLNLHVAEESTCTSCE